MNINLSFLPILFAIVYLGNVVISYIISKSMGHVPTWFPLVSHLGMKRPESLVFNYGWVISGFLFCIMVVVSFLRIWSLTEKGDHLLNTLNVICVITGVIAGFSKGCIGVANYSGDTLLHVAFTNSFIIFGTLMSFLMVIVSVLSGAQEWIWIWRLLCSIAITMVSCCFCIFYAIAYRGRMNWSDLSGALVEHTEDFDQVNNTDDEEIEVIRVPHTLKVSACFEYLCLVAETLWLVTFYWDFSEVYLSFPSPAESIIINNATSIIS